MKVLEKNYRLCPCCMEEHEVETVTVKEQATFKDTAVEYDACYQYCDTADELFMDEEQMRVNDTRLKDAYRKAAGLLTSAEIAHVRSKYGISQSDLCALLGWGGKTITRYESHQVQDKAHDTILKKIAQDPEWFIALLQNAKDAFSEEAYRRYLAAAMALYEAQQDMYLRRAIQASYVRYQDMTELNGNAILSLDKVVDVIRYFAASKKVTGLYKVKLMKLLWYADALSFKQRGEAITGLVYQALPMGAVPVGHRSIIDLGGVPCEEIDTREMSAYHFMLKDAGGGFPALSGEDIKILDEVISRLGDMTTEEIVDFMHREKAYTETAPREIIPFKYAAELQI